MGRVLYDVNTDNINNEKRDIMSSPRPFEHSSRNAAMETENRPLPMEGTKLRTKDCPDGSRVVVRVDAGARTLQGLQELRSNPHLCDVKFRVEGKEYLAHRCVLVLHSAYFHAMFSSGFLESTSLCSVIEPPADVVDGASVEAVLDFMYTGRLEVRVDTVQGIMMAAEHWQMTDVKQACETFMELHLRTNNCLGVLRFAGLYRSERLTVKCAQMVRQRFPLVCRTEEFLALPPAALGEILSFDDLSLGSEGEDVVLKALFRWFEFDPSHRRDALPTLLKTVRWNQTSDACMQQCLEANHLIEAKEEMEELVQELLQEDREARKAHASLYVIGGFREVKTRTRSSGLCSVERLDPMTRTWTSCADLPMLSSSAAMAFSLHGRLFCLACQPLQPVNNNHNVHLKATETGIFEYDVFRDEWLDAKPIFPPHLLQRLNVCLQAEGAMAVCSRTSTLYMISHAEFCSVSLDLADGEVICGEVVHLPRPVDFFSPRQRSHSAVVVDRRLYVLGGDRRDDDGVAPDPSPTSSVIVFDPRLNVWMPRADMLEARVKLAAAQFGDSIYACGGFHIRRLPSMERYDPGTDTWSAVQPMTNYRSHHQLVVFEDRIWALGGKSYVSHSQGSWGVVGHCEVYDPRTDTWTEGPTMRTARYGFAAVVV